MAVTQQDLDQLFRVVGAAVNTVQAHDKAIRDLAGKYQQLESTLKGFADQTKQRLKVIEANVSRLNRDVEALQKKGGAKRTDLVALAKQFKNVKAEIGDVLVATAKVADAIRASGSGEDPPEDPPAEEKKPPVTGEVIDAEFRKEE